MCNVQSEYFIGANGTEIHKKKPYKQAKGLNNSWNISPRLRVFLYFSSKNIYVMAKSELLLHWNSRLDFKKSQEWIRTQKYRFFCHIEHVLILYFYLSKSINAIHFQRKWRMRNSFSAKWTNKMCLCVLCVCVHVLKVRLNTMKLATRRNDVRMVCKRLFDCNVCVCVRVCE